MIDIIIPAYNAHKTIKRTLLSICLQSIKEKLKVYIVNDASIKNYSEEVDLFKNKINIKELTLTKNSGPGVARQYGIEHSSSPYIVFIDSDDVFFNTYSLKKMYETMVIGGNNMAIGKMVQEYDGNYTYYENHMGCLHGKMYSRKYIEKYNFKFNSTRSSEDHAFNRLYTISNPKIGYTNELVYLYKSDNQESITNKKDYRIESFKWYIYNAIWTVKEGEKRNFSKEKMARVIYTAIYYVYFEYLSIFKETQKNNILEYSKTIKKYYIKYDSYIKNEDKILIYKEFESRFQGIPKISFNDFFQKILSSNS